MTWNPRLSTVITLLFGFALQGCFALPQMEQQPSRVAFHANYDAGDKYVLFATGTQNHPKDYEISSARSYVIDPVGIHHPIRIQPHECDESQHFPFIRDDIFVLQSDTDSKPIKLHDGMWNFILTRRTFSTQRQDTFSFRLRTFYYNPLVHGPPN